MAVLGRTDRLHFLVLFCIFSSSFLQVQAVEEFLGQCEQTIDLMSTPDVNSGILEMPMPDSFTKYQDPTRPINCDIIITFTHGMHLLIELYALDIMPKSNDVKACSTGLEVFDQTGRKYYGSRLCMEGWEWDERHQEKQQEKQVVMNSPLTFRLVSQGPYRGTGFKVHFNQFRPYWPCYTREYKCEQIQRCVHDDLTCDGWDDCGDNSDEREEAGCDLLTASEICAIIIGVLLVIGTVAETVWVAITYKRRADMYGVKSESKVPITEDRYGMGSLSSFPRRYNSQESMSRLSRVSGPPMVRHDSESDIVDKRDLEKADRMSNRTPDNLSERSYRSNARKSRGQSQGTETGNGQYGRQGRTASKSSLNRDRGDPPIGPGDVSLEKLENDRDRRSLERERRDRDRSRYSDSEDERYYEERRRRRRSRERDYRRDDRYSDEDSDYERDRSRRRRRRSYDRDSDDSDYEYERDRERRRRSRERCSRERPNDRDDSDRDKSRDLDQDPDRPPRRQDSRERDRDRYRDEYRDRRRSPSDDEDDEERRYRRRRRRSPYDDDDDDRDSRRRRRSNERRRSAERDRGRPRSGEGLPPKGRDDDRNSDSSSLPPPPSGEDIRRMELEKNNMYPPSYEAIFDDTDGHPADTKRMPRAPPVHSSNLDREPKRAAVETTNQLRPAPNENNMYNRAPREAQQTQNLQRSPVTNTSPDPRVQQLNAENRNAQRQSPRTNGFDQRDPRQDTAPAKSPADAAADQENRLRSTDNRRERYSRDRWQPKNKRQSPPPSEYEDVAPRTVFVDAGYKEETV